MYVLLGIMLTHLNVPENENDKIYDFMEVFIFTVLVIIHSVSLISIIWMLLTLRISVKVLRGLGFYALLLHFDLL